MGYLYPFYLVCVRCECWQIPQVADLPVGENLQDQVMADGIEMFTPYSGFTVTAARAENLISAWAYSIFGTGIACACVACMIVKWVHILLAIVTILLQFVILCRRYWYCLECPTAKSAVVSTCRPTPFITIGLSRMIRDAF